MEGKSKSYRDDAIAPLVFTTQTKVFKDDQDVCTWFGELLQKDMESAANNQSEAIHWRIAQ